jgi:CRP/FNR family cyclic AMP-dependent transcriptional regulator
MSTDVLGRIYGDCEIVVRQGDAGNCMFAVQEGLLEVVRETPDGPVRLGVLHEGDIFGEMAILEGEVRSATVRALGKVRLLTIDKKTLLRRMHEDPSILLEVVKSLCGRVRRLNAELANLKRRVPQQAPG